MSASLNKKADDDVPTSALSLFRWGFDTCEIAKRLGITEAAASLQVHEQRSALIGLPVEYERRRRP